MTNMLSKIPQPVQDFGKDFFFSALGLGVLRFAGLKFEVAQINLNTLVFGAGLTALSGSAEREVANLYTGDRKGQDSAKRLACLVAFAAGAFALTQYDKVSSHLPAVTKFASCNQALLAGFASIASVAGFRFGIQKYADYAQARNEEAAKKLVEQELATVENAKASREDLEKIASSLTTKLGKEAYNTKATDLNESISDDDKKLPLFQVEEK